jgi:hypothetical protein
MAANAEEGHDTIAGGSRGTADNQANEEAERPRVVRGQEQVRPAARQRPGLRH